MSGMGENIVVRGIVIFVWVWRRHRHRAKRTDKIVTVNIVGCSALIIVINEIVFPSYIVGVVIIPNFTLVNPIVVNSVSNSIDVTCRQKVLNRITEKRFEPPRV